LSGETPFSCEERPQKKQKKRKYLTIDARREIRALRNEGPEYKEIAKHTGFSITTCQRAVKYLLYKAKIKKPEIVLTSQDGHKEAV